MSFLSSIGNSISSTAQFIVQSKRGFKHGDEEVALFDAFRNAQEVQIEFSHRLKMYAQFKTKQLAKENDFVDSLNTLALRGKSEKKKKKKKFENSKNGFLDGGNKSVVRTSARKVKDVQKLDIWLQGFNTISGLSEELVKEMSAISKRIEALNHQIAELEALRKKQEQKENASNVEKEYKMAKAALVSDVKKILEKKNELNTRWMDKLDVLDQRLNE